MSSNASAAAAASSSDSSSSSSSSSSDSDPDRRLAVRRKITHHAGDDARAHTAGEDEINDAPAAQQLNPIDALAAAPSAPLLPLPLPALHRILDALSLSDLLCASLVARSWYGGCVRYSQTMATAASPAVVRPTLDLAAHSCELPLLFTSHLRGLVTALDCARSVIDVLNPIAFVSTAPALPPRSLPALRTLHIHLSSPRHDVTLHFPSTLTELHLALSFHTSSTKRGAPVEDGKPPPSWTSDECDQFVERAMQAVARLPNLRSFFFSAPLTSSLSNATPAAYWLAPLRAAPVLETLGFDFDSFRPIAELRALPHLRQFVVPSQRENAWRDCLPKLLAPPHHLQLTQLPLRTAEISRDSLAFLLTLSGCLETLAPRHWDLVDLSWLSNLRKLTRLSFKEYTYSSGLNPSVGSILDLLPRMPQLTSLTIAYPSFDSEHLESVLGSLPLLGALEVESKAMQSLAPFGWHPGLARTMTDLKLCCPRLQRDEISVLLCLLELKSLDIAGSFTEPLYARQLAPFEPPYPKRPLHWLRSFTPRSEREPVPSPPVDKAALAAAHAAFDARVRAGEVAAAELLNAGQLSGVFRFLSMRDFSLAARSCRAWRSAASLPSAWGFSTPVSAAAAALHHDSEPLSDGWTLSLFHVLSSGADLLPPHEDRLLRFTDKSPELSVDILPYLALWRNARGLMLQLNSQPAFSAYWSASLVAERRHKHEAPLRALKCLTRLESLMTDWTPYTHTDGVVTAFGAVGARLRRVDMSNLPRACWAHLANVRSMYYHWTNAIGATEPSRAPDVDALACMHSLHTLVLRASKGQDCPGLGSALRTLSQHHSLRHLCLELGSSTPSTLAADNVPWPLETLLTELTGISCMSSPPATDEAEHKELVEHALAEMASVLVPSRFSPAAASAADTGASMIFPPAGPPSLLESFSLLVSEDSKLEGGGLSAFPIAAVVLGLPHLRRLHLTVLVPQAAADLGSLERVASFFPDRHLELESLCLGVEVASASFEALRVFTRLTALRLMDSRACRNAEALSVHTSNMKLQPGVIPDLVRCMPRLSFLVIDAVEVPSGDLGCLASLAHLKSLRLFRQDALQLADLDVLARCTALEELTLARLDRVPLQARTWMLEHGRQLSTEDSEESKMISAYEQWRQAKNSAARSGFAGENENGTEEELDVREQEEKVQTEANLAEEAAASAAYRAEFADAMMDDAPPAAAAPAAAAAVAPAATAAAAPAAGDDLPPLAPVALVKQVSKLLVDALNTHLAARSKSAELFAATIAAHPQRASEFADLLHLLRSCCARTKLRRFNWSPSHSILESNVAYTWSHSHSHAPTNAADRGHEARVALERARDRVALRALVKARQDEIELAKAAAAAAATAVTAPMDSAPSNDGAAASSSAAVVPPPLLIEMRLASHLPYTRLRTLAEQSLCPPLSEMERALSHPPPPQERPQHHFYSRSFMHRHRRPVSSQEHSLHGEADDDDSDVRNIDDPATDAEKLQQEQVDLQKAKEEAAAAQGSVVLGTAPTSAACAAASASVAPMSDA